MIYPPRDLYKDDRSLGDSWNVLYYAVLYDILQLRAEFTDACLERRTYISTSKERLQIV